jgi:hypothetical protein
VAVPGAARVATERADRAWGRAREEIPWTLKDPRNPYLNVAASDLRWPPLQ